MKISRSIEDKIRAKVASGPYDSPEEVLRDALDALDEHQRLEEMLLDAIGSGDPIEITPDYWEVKRQKLLERHVDKK